MNIISISRTLTQLVYKSEEKNKIDIQKKNQKDVKNYKKINRINYFTVSLEYLIPKIVFFNYHVLNLQSESNNTNLLIVLKKDFYKFGFRELIISNIKLIKKNYTVLFETKNKIFLIDFKNIDQILNKKNKAVDLLKLKPLLNKENITIKTKNGRVFKGTPLQIFKPQLFLQSKLEFNSKTYTFPFKSIKAFLTSKEYREQKNKIKQYRKELSEDGICKQKDFF